MRFLLLAFLCSQAFVYSEEIDKELISGFFDREVPVSNNKVTLGSFFSAEPPQSKKKEPEAKETCGLSCHPHRIEARHIEANGIGYNKGYSTLETFLTVPSTLKKRWVPFFDARGHVFNDGKWAANAGLGLRYLGRHVWGINVFYDYRKTQHQHYNQIGAGLEMLGKLWDFRINGYLPVGEKESPFFQEKEDVDDDDLFKFGKREIAMKAANAEIGLHALDKKKAKIYVAAGPYYIEKEGHIGWGGEGRLALTLVDHIRMQLSGSYDMIFHGIVQGELSLIFPFGGKKELPKHKKYPCSLERTVRERAVQKVDRFEIIVIDQKHEHRWEKMEDFSLDDMDDDFDSSDHDDSDMFDDDDDDDLDF